MKGFWGWVIGVALVAGAAYYFLFAGGSAEGVQIVFKGPEKISYGAPFELKVGVGNSSVAVWKSASLSLTLPTGFIFIGGTSGGSFITKQIGDMGICSFTEIPFTVMAVAAVPDAPEAVISTALGYGAVGKGEEPMLIPVAENPAAFVAELSYVQGGSSAIFQKTEEWLPPASTSGFELTLTAPEKAASGEEAEISITYANKTGEDLDGLVAKATSPRSFVFASASAEADAGDGTWNIGSLKRGSADSILIKGRFAEAGTAQFSVSVARANGAAKYPIAAAGTSVEVTTAPLALVMDVNDQPDYVARTGDTLAYTLSYTMDGLTPAKSGLTITADLFSPLFDSGTVGAPGGGRL